MAINTQESIASVANSPDRRREPRHFVCYGRPLHVTWTREESLLAALINVSRTGFRLSHQYRHFHVGQEVSVAFPRGMVRARVAWNRVGKKNVQTGFAVVEGLSQETMRLE